MIEDSGLYEEFGLYCKGFLHADSYRFLLYLRHPYWHVYCRISIAIVCRILAFFFTVYTAFEIALRNDD